MEKIGGYLERLRLEAELSLGQAGEAAGVDRNNLWQYEKGRMSIPDNVLESLSGLYGVPLPALKARKALSKLTPTELKYARDILNQ